MLLSISVLMGFSIMVLINAGARAKQLNGYYRGGHPEYVLPDGAPKKHIKHSHIYIFGPLPHKRWLGGYM